MKDEGTGARMACADSEVSGESNTPSAWGGHTVDPGGAELRGQGCHDCIPCSRNLAQSHGLPGPGGPCCCHLPSCGVGHPVCTLQKLEYSQGHGRFSSTDAPIAIATTRLNTPSYCSNTQLGQPFYPTDTNSPASLDAQVVLGEAMYGDRRPVLAP